ncbi:hypothetical protein K431DRAFT_341778 [Polychaeton citri CBS 116435]|uniref:glucan endo-1,3-beta-D-glucosidase n=1 Tax=Polychaeton citri CBS 116435 TaxID=1314669 RepID=A0A9P4UID5_9PEZI|nr:hypothetical protein K431DRAFT_341778 [Polychaeton citri CBS 116435]
MKYFASTAAILGLVTIVTAQGDGCFTEAGNWYCNEVDAITYTDVGNYNSTWKYNKLTEWSTSCSSEPSNYQGPLSPFDEQVSLHLRGPINLKQFAFYAPSSSASKVKSRRAESHLRRHLHGRNAHAHAHLKRRAEEKRQVGALVTNVVGSVTEVWTNAWNGYTSVDLSNTPATSVAAAPASVNTGFHNLKVADVGSDDSSSSAAASSAASSSETSSVPVPSGNWGRSAYYNAQAGSSSGLAFLNNKGDNETSGIFDHVWGSSLSYATTDGCNAASAPQTLEDITFPDGEEFSIFTDQECSGDDCGVYRTGTVAHKGFDGANKAFFFEFSMPDSGETAADQWDIKNAPALWMLNAQIPRTLQYPPAQYTACSCWYSGCGEFDIFEVITPGSDKAKSTFHGNKAAGSSDYFKRPTGDAIKVAAVMYDDKITVRVLDSSYDFPESLDEDTIASLAGARTGSSFVKQLLASDTSPSEFCMEGHGPDQSNVHYGEY